MSKKKSKEQQDRESRGWAKLLGYYGGSPIGKDVELDKTDGPLGRIAAQLSRREELFEEFYKAPTGAIREKAFSQIQGRIRQAGAKTMICSVAKDPVLPE